MNAPPNMASVSYRSIKLAIFLISHQAALAQSGEEPFERPTTDQIAEHLEVRIGRNLTNRAIWASRSVQLAAKDSISMNFLREKFKNKNLVMVTLRQTSALALQLQTDPRTIIYSPPQGDRPGFAMLDASDPLVLEGLAVAAHAEAKPYCGALEIIKFFPVTSTTSTIAPVYATPVYLADVEALMSGTNEERITNSIQQLVALGTRYHTTTSGLQTPDKVQELLTAGLDGRVPTSSFEQKSHAAFASTQQKSVILSIPGQDDDDTTVILGAHLDSIHSQGSGYDAPGADDDASGVATLIEVARVIAAAGATFARRVEFHAYAAEEVGLIGSSHIAHEYAAAGRSVAAMMQLDMNSFTSDPDDQTIFLVENDTSANLRRDVKDLLWTYLGGDFAEDLLIAGTSDHRAWTKKGFAAVFPFENPRAYNTKIHTDQDTIQNASNHKLSERFAKLALAFIAHHAGLKSAASAYTQGLAELRAKMPSDLKLAVSPASSEGYFDIAIAGPTSLARVELCAISEAGSIACTAERMRALQATGKSDSRSYFASSEPIAISAGMRLALFGYDEADKMLIQRSVRFGASNDK